MAAGRGQLQGVGRRPVEKRLRGRIQGGGTRRGCGRNKRVGRGGRKVGRPGAPDARDERQRRHGRSRRTGNKERMLFVRKRALSIRRKAFFADAHQSEVLGLVLPGLRSNIGWILLRIGINMECICVQGIRRTVKKRYGCLPRRCRASRWLPILADSGLKDIKLRWF